MFVKSGGWMCIADPESGTKEWDTFTCFHCGKVTQVPARARPEDIGGLCYCCMRLICPACVGKGCSPLIRKIEQMEEADRIRHMRGL